MHAKAMVGKPLPITSSKECSFSCQIESNYQIWLKSDDKWEHNCRHKPKNKINWSIYNVCAFTISAGFIDHQTSQIGLLHYTLEQDWTKTVVTIVYKWRH